MPKYSLTVKGNESQALNAALARELYVCHSKPINHGRETILHVETDNFQLLSDWFSEANNIVIGQEYPHGTLLFYVEIPRDE